MRGLMFKQDIHLDHRAEKAAKISISFDTILQYC